MRSLIPCLAVAVLAAGDPPPAAFIPAAADVAIQVPDIARSRTSWAKTPYPRLLATGWGRTLCGEWGGRLERIAPGASTGLDTLTALAVALRRMPDADPQVVAAIAGGPALPVFAAAMWPSELPGAPGTRGTLGGRFTTHGQVLAWMSGAGGAVQPGTAPPAPAANADAGMRLVTSAWLPTALGATRVDFQLDPIGLRETAVIAASDASRLAAVAPRAWADPQELRRLPATTLCAATWHSDPALVNALLDARHPALAPIEAWLAACALPSLRDTIAACSGPATVWMAEGVPFPTCGAAISMSEVHARRWIAAAASQLHLTPTTDGAAGFVGLVPIALAWNPAGRLIISSDPAGAGVWPSAKPGFAEQPGVAESMQAAPARTLLLGVGRGGASWAALAQVAVPLFTAMGAVQAVSLPGDLRLAAKRGWLYVRLLEDGSLRCESAGLFGGPCAVGIAAGIAVPATMWLHEQQRQMAEPPAAEAPRVY